MWRVPPRGKLGLEESQESLVVGTELRDLPGWFTQLPELLLKGIRPDSPEASKAFSPRGGVFFHNSSQPWVGMQMVLKHAGKMLIHVKST